MVGEARVVTWGEAGRILVWCSVVCGVVWAVLALLGEYQLPVAAPVVMLLVQWFWDRHRHWGAGVAAGLSGAAVVFVLVDGLRPHLDRLTADALATEAGAAVALVVFTGWARLRRA
ncbi:hypothetical protein [Streptomyces antibioticus]|uniref:hypothetical protein n=1 Tax=Streptomyces antibioticus TaxID=1890 RepID=UPI00224FC709|nr:hypothetical protein [Streptomyces antibioticus]MCX4738993.1 hypothetical protein [Streptomyces antibioticus]